MKKKIAEIGPQSKSDAALTAKYRMLQSEYRAKVLNVQCGKGPNKNSTSKYGNMLINGENSGLNFVSSVAFKFAKQKVLDKQIKNQMLIDEFRLFNNMLSSMPMCFNLFSDLRDLLLSDPNETSRIIKLMFPEIAWIERVTYIDIEFIPVPISDYTDDKSAFDALILAEDKGGKKGLISIETKYTDLLGSNSASRSDLKNSLVERKKIFDEDLKTMLRKNGYGQIHRNYLLTYAYAQKHKFKHFVNVVISPEDDVLSIKEIEQLKTHLLQNQETIKKSNYSEHQVNATGRILVERSA